LIVESGCFVITAARGPGQPHQRAGGSG
jgi:hypothetical protein